MRAFGDTSKLQSLMLSCRPAPPLRHLIRYYYQVETHLAGSTSLQPVPARSPQAIEFTFGAPYEVRRLDRRGARNAYPIALIGSQTFRRVELLMRGNIDAFTIVFQPGGVSTLFSVPAEELTNDDFEGEAVLGRGLGEFLHRLSEVSSFADRARVADAYLCAKRPGGIPSARYCQLRNASARQQRMRLECPILRTTQGWGPVNSSGAFATRLESRPSYTPESSDSRRPSDVRRRYLKRRGPRSPMLWDITIRCTWCTISIGCRETVPQPSAANSTCLQPELVSAVWPGC